MNGSSFFCTIRGGPTDGLVYPVVLPTDKAIWAGTYEARLADSIAHMIPAGAVCCDIGGYRGYFSGLMAVRGASKVHVFEPFPENCAQIERMVSCNPTHTIVLHRFALGEVEGESRFSVLPEASMGKLEGSPFSSVDSPTKALVVKVRTLNGMLLEGLLDNVSVMKIDVEGAEAMVLRGADQLLGRHHPAVFIEAHSRALCQECDEFLSRLGYRVQVLETGQPPDGISEPEICHLVAFVD